MIAKDFHFAKDFPLIRGKSFATMTPGIGRGAVGVGEGTKTVASH